MFESLQSRLGGVFDKLRGRGALSEADVDAALGEVRTALIDADVALPVVKDFIEKVRPRAIGENVIRSVTPGQQVIKIVHDVLVETLGEKNESLNLGSPPAPILMVGLQGSGKTTTSAKLGLLLQTKRKEARADGVAGRQPSRRHGTVAGAGRTGRRRHPAGGGGPGSRRPSPGAPWRRQRSAAMTF